MTVAVELDFRGATLEQYDEINERLGVLPGAPAQPREFSHWVAKTDDGFRVVDVWESREAFVTFVEEKLSPIFEEVGVPHPPEIHFFEVHNYHAGRRGN
jgi:hypothetical protein